MISYPEGSRPPAMGLWSSGFAAAGDAAAFGEILGHHARGPAAGLERIADFVHEGLHVEDSAAARFHQILWIQRIAHLLRVEPLAFVGDGDGEVAAVDFERGVHPLAYVELVSMFDGVGDGFAHGHADPVRAVLVESGILTKMLRDHLHELDIFESAADGDFDALAVAFHRLTGGILSAEVAGGKKGYGSNVARKG